jgi:hypothetical protein
MCFCGSHTLGVGGPNAEVSSNTVRRVATNLKFCYHTPHAPAPRQVFRGLNKQQHDQIQQHRDAHNRHHSAAQDLADLFCKLVSGVCACVRACVRVCVCVRTCSSWRSHDPSVLTLQ